MVRHSDTSLLITTGIFMFLIGIAVGIVVEHVYAAYQDLHGTCIVTDHKTKKITIEHTVPCRKEYW